MKIKRLTAGLAVAAMAATFFAAAPVLSAQANIVGISTPETIKGTPDIGTVYNTGNPVTINVMQTLGTSPATSQLTGWTWVDGFSNTTLQAAYNSGTAWLNRWYCIYSGIVDPKDPTNSTTLSPTDGSQGTLSCDANGNLIYKPALAMGQNGDAVVTLYFQLTDDPNANAEATFAVAGTPNTAFKSFFEGWITLTVSQKPSSSGCAYDNQAQCLTADLQAFAKKDGPASAKIDVISPNVKFTDKNGNVTGFITGDGNWGLYSIDSASSVDNSIKSADLMKWVTYGTGKGANLIKFTLPATQYNWSGSVSYVFALASYNCGADGVVAGTTTACKASITYGLATFIVHPTLPDMDPIASDPGTAVKVPVLEQTIIGSKPFANAACTFADTKSKTTLSGTGTISNKGGSKDPVFTPDAAFSGSVDLTCTVQDKFGIGSNSVTVTIQVGVPAPAPVAPTPACTSNCGNGVLSVTGGSLATPMSSGLAAVVLLVAAGAGILVVRRRTALAG